MSCTQPIRALSASGRRDAITLTLLASFTLSLATATPSMAAPPPGTAPPHVITAPPRFVPKPPDRGFLGNPIPAPKRPGPVITRNPVNWVVSELVVLGDSLSDTHNFKDAAHWVRAPNRRNGYYDGRFTNGYTWVDFIGQLAPGLPIDNGAFGGAQSTGTHVPWTTVAIPNLASQTAAAISRHHGQFRPDTAVVIWIGANDILNNVGTSGSSAAAAARLVATPMQAAITKLLKAGVAKNHLFLVDLAPMDRVPYYAKTYKSSQANARSAVAQSNADLAELAVRNGVQLIPAHAFIDRWLDHRYTDRYLTDFTNACYTGPIGGDRILGGKQKTVACPQKMFFDLVHPTALAHCGLALLFKRYLVDGGAGLDGFNFGYCSTHKMSPLLPPPAGTTASSAAAKAKLAAAKANAAKAKSAAVTATAAKAAKAAKAKANAKAVAAKAAKARAKPTAARGKATSARAKATAATAKRPRAGSTTSGLAARRN